MWTSDAHGQRASEASLSYTNPSSKMLNPLELHDLEACVTATGNQDPPPAEWLFIRDARLLLNAGQNRRAVIDAATAAELAMATLIDEYLATSNTDEIVRTALAKKYKSLENRSDLLKNMRSGLLSPQLRNDLINPRNAAAHVGELLTDEEAQKAVNMAISVVEAAHPLASLLPTKGIREAEDR